MSYSGGPTPVEEVRVTDPGSKELVYHYDLANGGRMISRADGLAHTTSYGYDTGGFLNTVTDPNGVVVTTGHDVRGNTVYDSIDSAIARSPSLTAIACSC